MGALHRLHRPHRNPVAQAVVEGRRDRRRDQDTGAARIVVHVQAMLSWIVRAITRRIVVVMMTVVIMMTVMMVTVVMVVVMMNVAFLAMRVNVNE
jgi:hypothetical protein